MFFMNVLEKINREVLMTDHDGTVKNFIAAAKMAGVNIPTEEEREAQRKAFFSTLPLSQDLWVFAYGSLIWNPALEFEEAHTGEAIGWQRNFCIHAPIGRGTLETPGLMLGLDVGDQCKGKVYRIAAAHKERETVLLWRRECTTDVYIPRWIDVHTSCGKIKALAFTADQKNVRYRNHYTLEEKAEIIARASGQLGSNKDYLFKTVAALKKLGIYDHYLEALAEKILVLEKN
jgi:cation transport protein ChaC